MSPIDQARARHYAYALFGRLFLQPITADLLPFLQSAPDLAAVLPDPFDPDQAAAIHHTLFAFNLFPYASIFLDDSRLLGGPIASEHEAIYRQAGFTADTAAAPDHLGQSLTFLAHLSHQEAQILEAPQSTNQPINQSINQPNEPNQLNQPNEPNQLNQPINQSTNQPINQSTNQPINQSTNQPNYPITQLPITNYQSTQLTFLQNHLLPWLLPCAIAIQNQSNPFYTHLTTLILALTTDHYAALKSTQSTQSTNHPIHNSLFPPPITQLPNYQLPITNQPITNHQSPKEIARHLVTPLLSGLYLGRNTITHLSRRLNLPHGFGRRDQMLQTLFESAAQYDATPALLAALQELVSDWQQAYQQMALDYPETAAFLPPWLDRTIQTQQLLTR